MSTAAAATSDRNTPQPYKNGASFSTTDATVGAPPSHVRVPSRSQEGGQNGSSLTREHPRPAEEEGGAAKGESAGQGHAPSPPEPEGGYPEQLHAGKLDGVGPEYDAVNHVVRPHFISYYIISYQKTFINLPTPHRG